MKDRKYYEGWHEALIKQRDLRAKGCIVFLKSSTKGWYLQELPAKTRESA